jgi:hypothetical protein
MPLNPTQLDILGAKITVLADVVSLIAAQAEAEESTDDKDKSG